LTITLNKQWKYIGIASVVGITIIISLFFLTSPSTPSNERIGNGWVMYDAPVVMAIEGKYEPTISLLAQFGDFESGDIIYTRDGIERRGYFFSGFTSALDYLKENSPEDSTVLAWWDYGNMIIGYGEREALAINPSEKLLIGVTDPGSDVETDPDDVLDDIGKALTNADSVETTSILKKYNAKYLLVAAGPLGDEGKAKWIFYAGGISLDDMDNYWIDGEIVGQGRDTILYKMLNQEDIEGFKLIFSDLNTRVYRISP
jgi:hypothetical protein|tara:strand:- start:5446 stop:6219 length:774 start_codon:yes stop_codon:yes gene_type:complete